MIEKLRSKIDAFGDVCISGASNNMVALAIEIESELQELQSRIAELEKDAARYRWLRSGDRTIPEMNELHLDSYFEDELDTAIDTAMQKD